MERRSRNTLIIIIIIIIIIKVYLSGSYKDGWGVIICLFLSFLASAGLHIEEC